MPNDKTTDFTFKAASVGQRHREMTDAICDERAAQVEAIEALLAQLRPAWPAIVTPMTISGGPAGASRTSREPQRFFCLEQPRKQPGPVETSLYVDSTGALFWFHPQTGVWGKTTPEEVGTTAIWPIESWVQDLWIALEGAKDGKSVSTLCKALDRAAVLRAIAYLLDPAKARNVDPREEK